MREVDLEAAERDAFVDLWSVVPPAAREAFGFAARRVGDGVMLQAPGLQSLMMNRLLGYGLAHPPDAAELDAAIADLTAAGSPWAIQVPPWATALAALAAACRLVPHPRAWMRFVRGNEPVTSQEGALAVRPVAAGEAEAFGTVFCAAFGLPPALGPWAAALPARPRWRCFLAWDGEVPAGTGALFLGDGEVGWLGMGGVLGPHRGRGGQTALLAARIEAGRAEGCRHFTVETGVALPGEAAPSYRNILAAGFREAWRRENLHRPVSV
jgi:hypothetical protein